MDVREKLVELLEKTPGIGWSPSAREIIADTKNVFIRRKLRSIRVCRGKLCLGG